MNDDQSTPGGLCHNKDYVSLVTQRLECMSDQRPLDEANSSVADARLFSALLSQ